MLRLAGGNNRPPPLKCKRHAMHGISRKGRESRAGRRREIRPLAWPGEMRRSGFRRLALRLR
ncbi:hypothetical protein FHS03_003158 [Massilia violacea]|uniref:Uncharacterized protein n=1 Tax=Pseudoduganella violacea TaxID=1715466 RepID=A0A7W5BBJ0_9BURK|nr:hypothetical protein [Pseudoduganella violacea]